MPVDIEHFATLAMLKTLYAELEKGDISQQALNTVSAQYTAQLVGKCYFCGGQGHTHSLCDKIAKLKQIATELNNPYQFDSIFEEKVLYSQQIETDLACY